MSDDKTEATTETASSASLDLWKEVKRLMEEAEKDVEKNCVKGNVSAGVRVRKTLRSIRTVCAAMIKETTLSDKAKTAERKVAKAEEPAKEG